MAMNYLEKIIIDFELHSVDGINECFENGVNPNEIVDGKPLIYSFINMYSRGPLFKKCIQTFVNYGLEFEDKILLSVLLDDAKLLDQQLASNKILLQKNTVLMVLLPRYSKFHYYIFVPNIIIFPVPKFL
jgi:hypothetical protein